MGSLVTAESARPKGLDEKLVYRRKTKEKYTCTVNRRVI